LRERPEEIPVLVEYFLALYRLKHGGGPRQISPASLERLRRYGWLGNVRELQNVMQRIVVLGTESVIGRARLARAAIVDVRERRAE
jgi:DNA-binding NtrC family response regulator